MAPRKGLGWSDCTLERVATVVFGYHRFQIAEFAVGFCAIIDSRAKERRQIGYVPVPFSLQDNTHYHRYNNTEDN